MCNSWVSFRLIQFFGANLFNLLWDRQILEVRFSFHCFWDRLYLVCKVCLIFCAVILPTMSYCFHTSNERIKIFWHILKRHIHWCKLILAFCLLERSQLRILNIKVLWASLLIKIGLTLINFILPRVNFTISCLHCLNFFNLEVLVKLTPSIMLKIFFWRI